METNENFNEIKKDTTANNNNQDMQATQRIELIGELLKNTSEYKNEVIENEKNNNELNNALCEQGTNNEKIENVENSNIENENIQNCQEQLNNIPQNGVEENKKQEQNIQLSQSQSNNPNEKQHTQDKKDYRLERLLFERINAMQGKIKESLELIKKFERINAKEENLPNIVTTLHDKLTQEVIKQFRTVGIEFNMKSYLVQSIVSDLLNKFEEGITEFKECSENLNFVKEVQDDFESKVELAPTSKVKNMFARIRGLFRPERKQESIERLERERQEKKLEEANIHLIKYKFKNSELEKYTIRKNIVESLTHEILYGKGSGLNLSINEFVEEKISPEMNKLGLQYLIDGLKNELYKEYKEKQENVSEEEFFQMHVGDVKRTMKVSTYDIARSKIAVVTNSNISAEA